MTIMSIKQEGPSLLGWLGTGQLEMPVELYRWEKLWAHHREDF